jgi:hypothetical protein
LQQSGCQVQVLPDHNELVHDDSVSYVSPPRSMAKPTTATTLGSLA